MKLRQLASIDWALVVAPLALTAFGLAALYSFSFNVGKNLALYQVVYAVLGFAAMIFLTLFNYRALQGIGWYLYFLTLGLLFILPFFGSEIFGAKRWLDFGVFQLQPSEIAKLVLIFLFARIAAARRAFSWWHLAAIAVLIGGPTLLILKQPDLGTASVIAASAAAIIAHTKTPRFFWLLVIAAILMALPVSWSKLKPYQRDRVVSFFNPTHDPAGVGYNVTQAKIAIGSGGIWGRGLGQGSQSQLNFLPVAHSDFIFAAIGEATGFLGSVLVLGLYVILIWRGLAVAGLSQDNFGHYAAIGITAMWLVQTFVNMGMNMGLLPVTGIPLPFVSFGGSGLIVNFAAVGVLQSIYIRHKKIRFG